ncbi:AAA family ATPase [Sphingobacterium sp.]|uniref:ParA family protein n=1 Tax=Sphingobacterium sp. TaxID=341027 RepID=UPI0028A1F031|nr:AAA family ATPase [Sphingobacterium sp.]
MKIISLFNNKGGVGKSTLGFHLAYALSEMGHRTLMIDLDPQCNLTINGIQTEDLHAIWEEENEYIEDFEKAIKNDDKVLKSPRSIHFLLKPTEDGLSDLDVLPPTVKINKKLDLIPGRLSIHKFENKLAERWSGAYQGDNLAIRTITKIRELCNLYTAMNNYEYIIIDTSPSLGILNKTIISTVDGFFIPAQPDMFSLYGIRNIGNSLELWKKEFETIYNLISIEKRKKFPQKFVQFLGFTIYNAKKFTGYNEYDLAKNHMIYLNQIPKMIKEHIKKPNRELLSEAELNVPIGNKAVIHTHNTFPSVSQILNCPMWLVPERYANLKRSNPEFIAEMELDVNQGFNNKFRATKDKYIEFAKSLLTRISKLG